MPKLSKHRPELIAKAKDLHRQRKVIDSELRKVNTELGDVRPRHECLRCGHHWRGYMLARPPKHCARCHTASWDVPPADTHQHVRRPTDEPNPNWGKKKGERILPTPAPPPPPPIDILSIPVRTELNVDALAPWSRGLPPPPELEFDGGIAIATLPPPPSIESPQPERGMRPSAAPTTIIGIDWGGGAELPTFVIGHRDPDGAVVADEIFTNHLGPELSAIADAQEESWSEG